MRRSQSSESSASSPTYSSAVSLEESDEITSERDNEEEIIKLSEAMAILENNSQSKDVANKLVEIRSRPSGRYGMFRDLWALRLASFGKLDRQGGLPFSTQASDTFNNSPLTEARSMNDSLIQVSLPFLDNQELFGDYVNVFGGIRFGKIMEDLDVFAATCAYMHCGTSTTKGEKLTIVTAAVDRIDVHMRLDEPFNLRMKGMVSFVGKSSMEVTIIVESSTVKNANSADSSVNVNQLINDNDTESGNGWKMAALAKFIMVARNSEGPVQVPRLKLTSAREEAIFAAGAERHAARLSRAQQSLFKEPPTEAESILLHKMFLNQPSSINNASNNMQQTNEILVPISSTILTTTKLCHPQERNIHDLIFGGYLMREAFELGFTCGQLFSHSQLHFLAVDELAFKHPVPIGAVLQLTAQVVFTQNEFNLTDPINPASQLIHVEVVADVLNIQTAERKTTNTFHFTYRLESAARFAVRPSTYSEAMKYLEGKRRISAAPLDPLGTIYKF